jgi:hypothetical protein
MPRVGSAANWSSNYWFQLHFVWTTKHIICSCLSSDEACNLNIKMILSWHIWCNNIDFHIGFFLECWQFDVVISILFTFEFVLHKLLMWWIFKDDAP